jgi:hypothetical protein
MRKIPTYELFLIFYEQEQPFFQVFFEMGTEEMEFLLFPSQKILEYSPWGGERFDQLFKSWG